MEAEGEVAGGMKGVGEEGEGGSHRRGRRKERTNKGSWIKGISYISFSMENLNNGANTILSCNYG